MDGSLVISLKKRLPTELLWFFDEPPLAGNESGEQYERVFAAIADGVEPRDFIGWLFVKDIVDLAWETRRERLMKNQIVKTNQKEVVGELLMDSPFDRNLFSTHSEKANSWESDAKAREEIDQELRRKGHTATAVLAKAYERGASQIDAIDRRIASYELRRILIIREVALHCERLSRRLDKPSKDVIDTEFSQAAE